MAMQTLCQAYRQHGMHRRVPAPARQQAARQPSLGRVAARRRNLGLGDKGYVSADRQAAFTAPGKIWGVRR
jgi:hypothetical protein